MAYPSNVGASCRPVRRQSGAPGLSVQVLNVNWHRSNHLTRNHPGKKPSPTLRHKRIYFTCPLYPGDDSYQGTAASVTAHHHEVYPVEGNSLLDKLERLLQKTHTARIDMVSATSAATFTSTSAGTRLGAIELPQKPYLRIPMDWVASPLRETQPRPRPPQRKVPTKANRLQAGFCRGEY